MDALEVSRTGQTAHTVRIKVLPTQMPERYAISEPLAAVASAYLSAAKAFTKQRIVMAVWEYIKRNDLIKEDDCRMVVCDTALARVFACEQLPFASVVVALKTHLIPVHSVDLEYTLRVTADASSSESESPAVVRDEKLVDVDVGAVDTLERVKERVLAEWEELVQEQQKDLGLLKQQESDLVERLYEQCRKREWMEQFAQDPVGFMKDVAQSQQADQQVRSAVGCKYCCNLREACESVRLICMGVAGWRRRSSLRKPRRTRSTSRIRSSSPSLGSAKSSRACSQPHRPSRME